MKEGLAERYAKKQNQAGQNKVSNFDKKTTAFYSPLDNLNACLPELVLVFWSYNILK